MDAAQILQDIALAMDLIARAKAAIDEGKADLSTTDLTTAKERLATVLQQSAELDAAFDAALAANG